MLCREQQIPDTAKFIQWERVAKIFLKWIKKGKLLGNFCTNYL